MLMVSPVVDANREPSPLRTTWTTVLLSESESVLHGRPVRTSQIRIVRSLIDFIAFSGCDEKTALQPHVPHMSVDNTSGGPLAEHPARSDNVAEPADVNRSLRAPPPGTTSPSPRVAKAALLVSSLAL